jgi:hypothetical protein
MVAEVPLGWQYAGGGIVSNGYRWRGFALPTYTQIPDEFFDELMVHLNEAELRVLLYLMRRTFGFKKEADSVSLKQLVEGITARDGRALDHGTGLSKSAVQRGLKGLREKQVIVAVRNRTPEQGDVATTYRLRLSGEAIDQPDTPPWSASGPGGTPPATTPLDRQRTTQETVEQQTVKQETDFEISKSRNGQKSHDAGATDDPAGRPMSLEERLAWQERMDAQERHLRRLRPKPPT